VALHRSSTTAKSKAYNDACLPAKTTFSTAQCYSFFQQLCLYLFDESDSNQLTREGGGVGGPKQYIRPLNARRFARCPLLSSLSSTSAFRRLSAHHYLL